MFIYTMNTVAIYIGGIGMMQFLTPGPGRLEVLCHQRKQVGKLAPFD